MRVPFFPVALAVAAASASCSSPAGHASQDAGAGSAGDAGSSGEAASDAGAEGGGAPAPFVFERSIPASSDSYLCAFIAPTATDGYLLGASHAATAGTHHLLVFRTDLGALPDGGGDLVDCFSGPANPMQHMRGEVYGSQLPSGSFAFPPGVGLPLRGGEVLLVQLHLSDPGASPLDVRVSLTLMLAGPQAGDEGGAGAVTVRAGVFFFDDPFIDIPAGALATASMRCLVPSDITLVSAASHDNALAQRVDAYLDPPGGPPATTPFYAGLNAANPLPLQASVPVAAGSHLRFVCSYQNVTGADEVLQGLDPQSDEMCVLSGAYYPAMDPEAESCALAPDGFGTGTATCAQALACVAACPPGSAPPPDLGLDSAPAVDPCWQRCVVASCSSASGSLLALERCTQANCAAECASPADPSCVDCQSAQCPMESAACASDTCGG